MLREDAVWHVAMWRSVDRWRSIVFGEVSDEAAKLELNRVIMST